MKTYIYAIPKRIQAFNKKIDAKAALCGKSWEVFNDEGVKQLFIFNTNGTIYITNNGKVLNGHWEFIPANSSILINAEDETIMFKPAFFNSTVFALQQDGIERYLFMIDESKKSFFPNLSLSNLTDYIEREIQIMSLPPEERKRLEQAEKRRIKDEKIQQKQLEAERKNKAIEQERLYQEEREEEEIRLAEARKRERIAQEQEMKDAERQLLIGFISEHLEEVGKVISRSTTIMYLVCIICVIPIIAVTFLSDETLIAFILTLSLLFLVIWIYAHTSSIKEKLGKMMDREVVYHDSSEIRKIFKELNAVK